MLERGIVKWFNDEKGFGFISRSEGRDLFVHHRSIEMEGRRKLEEGDAVVFEVAQGNKGPQAIHVRKAVAGEMPPTRLPLPKGGFFKLKRVGNDLEIQPISGESLMVEPTLLIPGMELVVG